MQTKARTWAIHDGTTSCRCGLSAEESDVVDVDAERVLDFAIVVQRATGVSKITGNHHITLVEGDRLFRVGVAGRIRDSAYGRKEGSEE